MARGARPKAPSVGRRIDLLQPNEDFGWMSTHLVPPSMRIYLDFPPWSLAVIATLDGFNYMDSVEVFRWQRDGFEVYG